MKINLRVVYNDGATVEATATTADLVAFEGYFSRSVARLEDEFRLTDVCWLAWKSLTRQGKTTADFAAWLESVDTVDFGSTEAAPVPLEPGASTST